MLVKFTDKLISASSARTLGPILKKTPRAVLDWKKEASFRKLIKYVYKNSPFYQKKFKNLNINPAKIKSPGDLGNFFTTPTDIVDHAEEFLCSPPSMAFESSGTTGRNKRIYLSQSELNSIGKFVGAGLFLGGLGEKDRIVNALDFCVWIPGIITQKGIENAKVFNLTAGKIDPMEVYKRIPTYNLNVIIGEPTWLIKLTEIAEERGSYPLKLLIGGAEALPDNARNWMRKVWQGAEVRMVYGTVESGGILGFEPYPECVDYHIDENNFYVEIVNTNAENYGEVVFTTLNRSCMPLIRYKNNDISSMIETPCACGLPLRKLAKLRGRADEIVVTSGGNLYPLLFEEILKDIDSLTHDWQIVFILRGVKEVMEFHLELRDNSLKDTIKETVFASMQQKYPDLWKNLSIGIFETDFIFHTPETIRKPGRKLIRIIDKRS
ncbi:MAG: phenylacetate--CoA ligase family protein [Candidatus Omnitrophica bacterium]|nr:phenylacetate--CoA ligase family protein [Candidatus Omnitrophota bacterium]